MNVTVGQQLPERLHKPTNVQLMLYNAALWNGHRIHFDEPYATEVEGYPGLVVAGPLIGDWLNQAVESWLGESGRLTRIEYSNRGASYIGDTIAVGGEVTAVDANRVTLSLYAKNQHGEMLAPGVATVELSA